jgi:hypothetical protein
MTATAPDREPPRWRGHRAKMSWSPSQACVSRHALLAQGVAIWNPGFLVKLRRSHSRSSTVASSRPRNGRRLWLSIQELDPLLAEQPPAAEKGEDLAPEELLGRRFVHIG